MKGYKLKIVGWAIIVASLWALISAVIFQGNRILQAMPQSTYGETQDVRVVNGPDDAVPVTIQPSADEQAANAQIQAIYSAGKPATASSGH